MLFACTKCHSRHPFDELSKEEQLCRTCRKKYPLTPCQYCQMEYHIMKKVDGSPVCTKCAQNISSYGLPKACKYCQILAAFKTSYCARCISSRKKYGEPVSCHQCKKKCAFNKSGEARAKVGGQILCLKCTMAYKKEKHEQQKLLKREGNSNNDDKHFNKTKAVSGKLHKNYQTHSSSGENLTSLTLTEKVIAPLKAENLAKTFKPRIETTDPQSGSRSSSPFVSNSLNTSKVKSSSLIETNNDSKVEPSFGDHMSEMTKLRDEIAMLKKVISQKEKIILEKDKKINEFNAERWDLEKLQRQKVSIMQKDFEIGLHKLRLENGELRKQVTSLKKKKAKFDEQTAKNAGKIRLEIFKPHSPALMSSKSYLDGQSENTDSDSEVKSQTIEIKEKSDDKNELKKDEDDFLVATDSSKDHKTDEEESTIENEKKLDVAENISANMLSNNDDDDEKLTESDNNLQKRKRKIKLDDQEDADSSSGEEDEMINSKKKKNENESLNEDLKEMSDGEVEAEISCPMQDLGSSEEDLVNKDDNEFVNKVDADEFENSDVINDFQVETSSSEKGNYPIDDSKSLENKSELEFCNDDDDMKSCAENKLIVSGDSSPQSCSGDELQVDET